MYPQLQALVEVHQERIIRTQREVKLGLVVIEGRECGAAVYT